MESRKIKGWRSRLVDELEQARLDVLSFGAQSVWVQESPEDRRSEGTGWGQGLVPHLLPGKGKRVERKIDLEARSEAQRNLKDLKDLVKSLRRAEGGSQAERDLAAKRMREWRAKMSPEKREAYLEKQREWKRQWWSNLSDERKAQILQVMKVNTQIWRDENRERFNAWSRDWYHANREKIIQKKRAKYAQVKDDPAFKASNAERVREYNKLMRQDPLWVAEQKRKRAERYQLKKQDPAWVDRERRKSLERYHAKKKLGDRPRVRARPEGPSRPSTHSGVTLFDRGGSVGQASQAVAPSRQK